VNGFGVREATFGFYFTRLGLPLEFSSAGFVRRRRADHAVFAQRRVAYLRRSVVS